MIALPDRPATAYGSPPPHADSAPARWGRLAARLLGASAGAVLLPGDDAPRVTHVDARIEHDDAHADARAGDLLESDALLASSLRFVAASGDHVIVADAGTELVIGASMPPTFGALLAVHLGAGGALCVVAPEPRAWTEADLRALHDLAATAGAELAAAAVEPPSEFDARLAASYAAVGTAADAAGDELEADDEERYRLVSLASNDVIWDWDLASGAMSWGDALRAFGHEAQTAAESMTWWSEHIHPEDRARVAGRIELSLASGERSWSDEYRFRRADGQYVPVFDRGTILRDADGVPQRMVGALTDVSDRRRAEELLRRQAGAMEASMDGIAIVDERDRVVYANDAFLSLYDYEAIDGLSGRLWRALFPPREWDRVVRQVLPLVTRAGRWRGEAQGVRADGSLFPQELSLSTLPGGGLVCVARDIERRRRVEDALRASDARFRAALEGGFDAFYILRSVRGASGRIADFEFVELNGRFEDLVGRPRSLVMGRTLSEITPSARATGFFERLTRVVDSGQAFEEESATPDPKVQASWVRVQVVPLGDGVAVTTRDITERKRAETELVAARDAAEAANRAKSDFLARMSHELRTPLNSVIGFANVLLRNRAGALGAAEVSYVQRIRDNGAHLLALINDILDLSKVEAGKLTVERAPVALDELLRATIAELEVHRRASVALDLRLPSWLDAVDTDAARLRQVLVNLIGNALKFTERGAVTVTVHADFRGRARRIDVTDTGIGIAPERREQVFAPFEQADVATTRRYGGTGLGLAISRRLCELLGFGLEMESEIGVGSRFSVVLESGRLS